MGCFWESNARVAAASAQGTLRKRRRWQRAHTKLIVVIEAVFQAPMFALNAAAFINACEPSHIVSKSPRRMSPEPRRSVQYTQGQLGERVRRNVLALDDRDARQPQRLIFRAVTYYRVCGVSILPEKSKARKQAPHPKPTHGNGTPWKWHAGAAQRVGQAWQPSTGPSAGKSMCRGPTVPY